MLIYVPVKTKSARRVKHKFHFEDFVDTNTDGAMKNMVVRLFFTGAAFAIHGKKVELFEDKTVGVSSPI